MSPEASHSQEPELSPEQESQVEDFVDKRGISYEMARRALGIEDQTGQQEVLSNSPRLYRKSYVRDLESDRDHDLSAARAAYKPFPENQPEVNQQGRELVENTLDDELGEDHRVLALRSEVEHEIPVDRDNVQKSLESRERLFRARWMARYGQPYSEA